MVIADAVRFCEGGPPPPPPPEPLLREALEPGVEHTRWRIAGPTIVNAVEFDLASPEYHLEMGWAKRSRNYNTVGREPLTTVVSRYDTPIHDTVAAINCAFFDLGGPTDRIGGGTIATLGNLDGIPSLSGHNEVFATLESGDTWVRRPSPASLGGHTAENRWANTATTPIGHLNHDDVDGEVIVYTPIWGASTASSTQAVEVVVTGGNFPVRSEKLVEGTISEVRTGALWVNTPILPGGLVIRGCPGTEATVLANAVVGQTVGIWVDLGPGIPNSASAITHGAGHLVDSHAQVSGSGWTQCGFWDEMHPRTVIASDGSRRWFVTFDGRQAPTSIGADFQMMADFLIGTVGVRDTINLDGGGSTTLVINGAVVNVVSFTPSSPGGDGYALEVHDPTGGFETVSVGGADDRDYTVQAHVYCDLRPEVSADGYERSGIFARDSGDAAFDSASSRGGGNCHAMIFDSNTGNVRGVRIDEGELTDLTPSIPISSDGWHLFRMETVGNSIRFYLDGGPLAETFDTAHPRGRVGLACDEFFATNSNALGGHFDNFLFEANSTVPAELSAFAVDSAQEID